MSSPDPKPDDLLSRAEEARRGAPVPDGPSEEMVARTLAALVAAAGRPEGPFVQKRKSMLAFLKVASRPALHGGKAG